jgi:hypothetical protein
MPLRKRSVHSHAARISESWRELGGAAGKCEEGRDIEGVIDEERTKGMRRSGRVESSQRQHVIAHRSDDSVNTRTCNQACVAMGHS